MRPFYKIRPVSPRRFLRKVLLPVVLSWVVLFLYVKGCCALASGGGVADDICGFWWKEGLFLVANYSLVKLLSPFLGWEFIFQRIGYALLGYFITTAGFGLVLLLASFRTPFLQNVALQFIIILLALDTVFGFRDEPDPAPPGFRDP